MTTPHDVGSRSYADEVNPLLWILLLTGCAPLCGDLDLLEQRGELPGFPAGAANDVPLGWLVAKTPTAGELALASVVLDSRNIGLHHADAVPGEPWDGQQAEAVLEQIPRIHRQPVALDFLQQGLPARVVLMLACRALALVAPPVVSVRGVQCDLYPHQPILGAPPDLSVDLEYLPCSK